MVAAPNRSPGPLFLRDSRALKISQNETIRKLVAIASINRLHFLLVPLPSSQEDSTDEEMCTFDSHHMCRFPEKNTLHKRCP